jgi:DNA-directed RNA polymerase specialized sigma24 family protein
MNAHLQLTFAAWLTALAVIGTAGFVGWLIACASIAIYRDLRRARLRKRHVIPLPQPVPDHRDSVAFFNQMQKRR